MQACPSPDGTGWTRRVDVGSRFIARSIRRDDEPTYPLGPETAQVYAVSSKGDPFGPLRELRCNPSFPAFCHDCKFHGTVSCHRIDGRPKGIFISRLLANIHHQTLAPVVPGAKVYLSEAMMRRMNRKQDKTMAQRAKFVVVGNEVTVSFDHPLTGERTAWTFTAPSDGGDVRERTVYGEYKQVCVGLASTGETLYLDGGCELVDLVRREFGRFKRSFKR